MKKTLETSFFDEHKDVALEWNYDRNGLSHPSEFASNSHKKVWWICSKGHEYEARIQSRTMGGGCPYCSGKKVWPGFNDLVTWAKENERTYLIDEWDYKKNGKTRPENVTRGTHKKVWWICPKGHSYQADIHNRSSKHSSGCPQCTSDRISINLKASLLKKNGSLAQKCPDIAAEWDYRRNGGLTPNDITYSGKQKYWWICNKGHSYKMELNHRTLMNCGCPYCSNNSHNVLVGFNDLESQYPWVAEEWDYEKNYPITPREVQAHANIKVWWKGKCNHEWRANIDNRTRGVGCPICAKEKQTSFPENALAYYIKMAYPDTICNDKGVLDGFEIDVFIPSLRVGIEYDGSHWHTSDSRDLAKNRLCSSVEVKLIRIREKGLQPLDNCQCIMLEDYSINQLEQAIKKVFAVIKCDKVPDVNIKRDQIDILNRYITQKKDNSLLECYPDIAKEWDYEKNGNLLPQMVSKGSEKRVWWICPKGHSYCSVVKSRTGPMHAGCKLCGIESTSKKTSKKVKCVETGTEYDSISKAARSLGISSGGITTACKKGCCAGGFHWSYLTPNTN